MVYADKALSNVINICTELNVTVLSKIKQEGNVKVNVEMSGYGFEVGFNVTNQVYYIILEGGKYKTSPSLDNFKTLIIEHIYLRTQLVPNCMVVAALFSQVYGDTFSLSNIAQEDKVYYCIFTSNKSKYEVEVVCESNLYIATLCKYNNLRSRKTEHLKFVYRLLGGNIVQEVNADYLAYVHKKRGAVKLDDNRISIAGEPVEVKSEGSTIFLVSNYGSVEVNSDFDVNDYQVIAGWLESLQDVGVEELIEFTDLSEGEKYVEPEAANVTDEEYADALEIEVEPLEDIVTIEESNSTEEVADIPPISTPIEKEDLQEVVDGAIEQLDALDSAKDAEVIEIKANKIINETIETINKAMGEIKGTTSTVEKNKDTVEEEEKPKVFRIKTVEGNKPSVVSLATENVQPAVKIVKIDKNAETVVDLDTENVQPDAKIVKNDKEDDSVVDLSEKTVQPDKKIVKIDTNINPKVAPTIEEVAEPVLIKETVSVKSKNSNLMGIDTITDKYEIRKHLTGLDVEVSMASSAGVLENVSRIKDLDGKVKKIRFEYAKDFYDVPVELVEAAGFPLDLIVDSHIVHKVKGLMITDMEKESKIFAKNVTDPESVDALISDFFD